MSAWRHDLNRLAMEFWCGVGEPSEYAAWADDVILNVKEMDSYAWDLGISSTQATRAVVLLKIAYDLNGFEAESLAAEPLAIAALRKALDAFLAQTMSVLAFCQLVTKMDEVYNIRLSQLPNPAPLPNRPQWWLGDLYNCCDWCDETWDIGNSQPLVAEAERVREQLSLAYQIRNG